MSIDSHAHGKAPASVEAGMVERLHLAGGYGHLQCRLLHWQPMPIDRAIRVKAALP